jgi:hypothetical protein
MKPLYITAGAGTCISTQGLALRVETPNRAPAVMSFRYLSQIISPANARWSTTALNQCMKAGVPVVFTDPNGRVIGFLHGMSAPSRGNVFARLVELLSQSQGMRTYTTWYKAMESRQRCRLCRHLRIPADRHRCRTLQRVCKRERHRRAERVLVDLLERTWHQALAGFAIRFLRDVGMSAHHQRGLWPKIDLASQLSSYLEWELLLPSLEVLSRLQQASAAGRSSKLLRAYSLARFSCLQPMLEERATHFIHRLDIRLVEKAIV